MAIKGFSLGKIFSTSIAAFAMGLAFFVVFCAAPAYAEGVTSDDKIHIMTLEGSDAIIVESNGVFGMVDSGEDDDYPDGSDPRYPLRPGITQGHGYQDEVIAYMRSIGVTSENFEFYIGTHPHSDHIGSADEVIRAFHPKRVYIPEYKDEYISRDSALWDNRYVYDRMIEAAYEVGSTVIWGLDSSAPISPEMPDADLDDGLGGGDGFGESDGSDNAGGSGESEGSGGFDDSTEFDSFEESNGLEESDSGSQTAEETGDSNGSSESGVDSDGSIGSNVFGGSAGSWAGCIMEDGPEPQHDPAFWDEVAGLDFQHSGIAAASNRSDGPVGTIGNPCFMLGDFSVEIMNYRDDYKTTPVGDANWFSWGVKVSAYGKSAFLAGDIGNYDGDEDRLAVQLGHVNVLKMGNHGMSPSSTLGYLSALAPDYAMWTSGYSTLPSNRLAALDSVGTRVWSSASSAREGCKAIVYAFSEEGVGVEGPDGLIIEKHNDSPVMTAYRNGSKTVLNGWQSKGNDWLWFSNSPYATESSWISRGGSWYYLGSDALMRTGWFKDGNTWYYADGSGRMQSGGWMNDGSGWYWLNGGGAMQAGWLWQGGSWYWLDPESGRMATGWILDGKTWYCADSSGRLLSGGWFHLGGSWYWLDSSGAMAQRWRLIGGDWYWFGESGAMMTGWVHDGASWYYMNPSGAMCSPGWISLGGSWYYISGNGSMKTGWLYDRGWYWLDPRSGRMATGWVRDGSNWYHLRNSGLMDSGGWLLAGGRWYWLNSSGAMAVGWISVDGCTYWLDEESGFMCTGLKEIRGQTYFFDASGAMAVNKWVPMSSSKVGLAGSDGSVRTYAGYMDNSGVHLDMFIDLRGWQDFEGQVVFVKQDGALAAGWLFNDGAWYWLSNMGFKQYGWLSTGGNWYWLDKQSGVMATGWIQLDDGWYWLNSSGAMATGWININDSAYKLGQNGRWVEDTGSVLNVSRKRLVEWLWSHENDGYYVGTPYSSGFSISTCTYPNGAPRWDGFVGMNCTGMVVHGYSMAGGIGDLGAIGAVQSYSPWLGGPGGGSYINAWRWYGYAVERGAEMYTFDSVASMLASGKAEKGDILFFKTNGSIDCHIGFFWGNTPYENKMWHQIYPYNLISTCFNNANKNELYQQTVLIKGC